MAARVILSAEATDQIRHIQRYVAEQSFKSRAAKYISRLRKAIRKLGDAPFQGTQRNELGEGFRSIGFERRITIVFVSSETSVKVVGIYYGGRQPTDLG